MKVYIYLNGGFGNNLFQIARAISICTKEGHQSKFYLVTKDLSNADKINIFKVFKDIDFLIKKRTLLDKMVMNYLAYKAKIYGAFFYRGIKLPFLLKGIMFQEGTKYKEYPYSKLMNSLYVVGSWQSLKYFSNVRNSVKDIFINALGYYHKDNLKYSVALHIRRGDYLSNKWSKDLVVCGDIYYTNSVSFINKTLDKTILKYFVYTNNKKDLIWIQNNYTFLKHYDVEYVDGHFDTITDFIKMIRHEHFVLSNSTFSWWASFLKYSDSGLILAPSKWNNGAYPMTDIYLDNWKIITT